MKPYCLASVSSFLLGLMAMSCSDAASGSADAASDAAAMHAGDGGGSADAAARFDAGLDAGVDAAAADGGGAPDAAAPWQPPDPKLPDLKHPGDYYLSQTGLYRDIADKTLAPDLLEFTPQHVLWADGADKRRFIRVPAGQQIDTGDMDHWIFPVGTMLFKEFSLAGKRLETRLVVRTGTGDTDYWMGAFLWNDDESDAKLAVDGADNVLGTEHDVPASKRCYTCHDGVPGRILGFSAVQLSAIPNALLSDPPKSVYHPPGDAAAQQALGYLHANCGHCHNPMGSARPDTDMDLQLRVSDDTVEGTNTYQTSVGVMLQYFDQSGLMLRIEPGKPEQSAIVYRMNERGDRRQMPPIATEQIHKQGVAWVKAWIATLR